MPELEKSDSSINPFFVDIKSSVFFLPETKRNESVRDAVLWDLLKIFKAPLFEWLIKKTFFLFARIKLRI